MKLAERIENLIQGAYEKGQTTVATTLQFPEMFAQEEIDELITDLRARGFRVTHDDVYNDMNIVLPTFTFAERARMIAYNTDSVTKHYIERISKDILTSAKLGYVEEEVDFYDIADVKVVDNLHEHFAREGFNVSRTEGKRGHIQLHIRWNK
jgi:hypothetical protein